MIYSPSINWQPIRPIGIIPPGFTPRTYVNGSGIFICEVAKDGTLEKATANSAHYGKPVDETLWDAYTFLIAPTK